MKNIFFKFCMIVSLLMVHTSCEDFLTEEPISDISVDYVYTTPGGLEVGVNALYNLMRSYNFPDSKGGSELYSCVFFYAGTDLGHTRTWNRPYGAGHNAAQFVDRKWTLGYRIIDRTNILISSAETIAMDEDEKAKLLAQVRAIRAELYFDLIRMYNNILLDVVGTTPENTFDEKVYAAADPVDVYALIDSDLDYAIANLEWDVPVGRYGQGVARHLRGKSAMWQGKWAEAAAQFDAIVDNGTHALVPNTADVFGQNLDHEEALFIYPRDQILGGNDNLAGGGSTWFGSVFNNRAYEMSGNRITQSVEYGGQSLGWFFPNDYLQSLYDQENDLRYTTYYYPIEKYVNVPGNPDFGALITDPDDNFRRDHFSLKKFHDLDKPLNTNDSFKGNMYYRFAETLLLGAEAHWRMDGENSASAKALEYINMVRARAGVPAFTSFDQEIYLEESARELAFERNRWFLLKRMGLLVERQSQYYTYGSNSGNIVVEPMAPHMVHMPIPQSEIDLMGTFPQNPGY